MNIPNPEPSLEERLRGVIRLKQYSRKTEETYVQWHRWFVRFQAQVHGQMRHPKEMGAEEVTAFDSHASSGVSHPAGFALLSLSRA